MSRIEPDPAATPRLNPLLAEHRASGVVDVRRCELGWSEAAVPPAVLVTYDVDVFDPSAFARHGVEMPANIGRSVKKRQAEFFMGRLAAGDALVGAALAGAALVGAAFVGAASAAKGRREHPSPLKRLLQEQRPVHLKGLQIGTGASREPVWPVGIVGSISHAGRYAAAVVVEADAAGIVGIGIDIEQKIGAETRQSVEGTVLNATEQALLRALGGELSYEMLLTIAFSAKESFFKGSFATVGTYFDFDAVEITALDVAGGTLELVLARSLAPSLPLGRRFTLRSQFIDADTVLTSFVW